MFKALYIGNGDDITEDSWQIYVITVDTIVLKC